MRHNSFAVRARELAIAAGSSPDARIPNPAKPDKTMPAWYRLPRRRARRTRGRCAAQVAATLAEQPPGLPRRHADASSAARAEHARRRCATAWASATSRPACSAPTAISAMRSRSAASSPMRARSASAASASTSPAATWPCGWTRPMRRCRTASAEILGDIRRAISFGVGRVNAERVDARAVRRPRRLGGLGDGGLPPEGGRAARHRRLGQPLCGPVRGRGGASSGSACISAAAAWATPAPRAT